ncbi:MAG: hypothetical protein ABIO76_10590, partial [Ginsengibacter sp.]
NFAIIFHFTHVKSFNKAASLSDGLTNGRELMIFFEYKKLSPIDILTSQQFISPLIKCDWKLN